MNTFIAIDLKSYYASVECVERGLDPLSTYLVVADESRTNKTICLAVSPALKALGIGGRPRLYEVEQKIDEINRNRKEKITYIVAPPRMSFYIDYSTRIYNIYLNYFSSEDIHVYSIDEVFIDATPYLSTYKTSARELTIKIIHEILSKTGITATAGIGTNLYLAKIAMDIVAKHIPSDKDGVRIAELNEKDYRTQLWEHTPLTDFWRIGKGTATHLERLGLKTMGDIALCSIHHEDFLFKQFGVNAEFLIDHAWGYEPCTIKAIKEYRPQSSSLSRGQVLPRPYRFDEALIVTLEMAYQLSLTLTEKSLLTSQLALEICYDKLQSNDMTYTGPLVNDRYGRMVPRPTGGCVNWEKGTASGKAFENAVKTIFEKNIYKNLPIRRIYLSANKLIPENSIRYTQLDIFEEEEQKSSLLKERALQKTIISIKKKFGSNSVLKGYSFEEGATAIERNKTIGGHKA